MKILVTGGCGFVGSHLVDRLVQDGHQVRVYDLLEPQVHGGKKPAYLNKAADYFFNDVRDRDSLKKALRGIEVVFHQAAQVGVGQSMYQIEKYVSHNSVGTAVLLELLVNARGRVKKLIVASSMSIYGEGAYRCSRCGTVTPRLRPAKQLRKKEWEMRCPRCLQKVCRIPTPEEKPLFPTSVYATTKRDQEELCLQTGSSYRLPTVALRYFNIYGPRQSLNNPYTGVAAIFLSRVKNARAPVIFEDGCQSRDFIHVSDIVEANILAMEKQSADYACFNVGTGVAHSILDVAKLFSSFYGLKRPPEVTEAFRCGDIRHCYADIGSIRQKLGFRPKVAFAEGMRMLAEWSEMQPATDKTAAAYRELKKRGLSS
jgi:dTDP-L-rhamnose 4-epimerase